MLLRISFELLVFLLSSENQNKESSNKKNNNDALIAVRVFKIRLYKFIKIAQKLLYL